MLRKIEVQKSELELSGEVFDLDIARVSVKNIQKVVDTLNLDYTPLTVFVSWQTEVKLYKATRYVDNLIAFKNDNGTWSKTDLKKSRQF